MLAPRVPGARRAGFTMVELMVVCLIIAMISGVAYVSWQSMTPKARLHAAVRGLSEHLHGARSEAIARSREFEIHYQIDEDRYWVRTPYKIGGGMAIGDEDRALLHQTDLTETGLTIYSVTIDDRVYSDGEVYVRFDPLGAGSAHTVVFWQEIFDAYYTVEALPLTGEIRYHDGIFARELPDDTDFN